MAPNWDEDDGDASFEHQNGLEEEGGEEAAEALVQDLVSPQQDEAAGGEEPQDMDEVDRRLKLAGYYRTVIEGQLFEEDDPDAAQVQAEIHGFVRGRLRVLMGMGDGPLVYAQAKPQFSDSEVEAIRSVCSVVQGATMRHLTALTEREIGALRALAAVAMKTKGLVPAKAPPAPGPAPAPPTLKKKTGPAGPARPAAPAPKPPAAKPPAAPAPAARPALARGPKRPGATKKAESKPLTIKVESSSGAVRKDGTPVMSELALVQKPAGMVPFPSEQQMVAITSTQAQMATNLGVAANGDRQGK